MKLEMSSSELSRTQIQVDEANKKAKIKHKPGENGMGKDTFIKLLITQLKHQDPTKAMEDREFIAQMAQFSALEQMTNINKEIESMRKSSKTAEAYGLLGKNIDSFNTQSKMKVSGIVTSIQFTNNDMKLIVGGREVSMNDVQSVHNTDNAIKENTEVPREMIPMKQIQGLKAQDKNLKTIN